MPQVGVLTDLCVARAGYAQVSEYRDLWHPLARYFRGRTMFKNALIESAMRRIAERRIEEAMRAGKFKNLKGAGKPIDPGRREDDALREELKRELGLCQPLFSSKMSRHA